MLISPDVTRHVARLARLGLTEAEVERMTAQLGQILEHVDRLKSVDVTEVPPTSHSVDLFNVTRSDDGWLGIPRQDALASAPDRSGPYFRVPAIVDAGGEERT